MKVVTLYVTQYSPLTAAQCEKIGVAYQPRWYVCTEQPFQNNDRSLDAPWLYASPREDGAREYARAMVRAYRDQPRTRYQIAS